MFSVGFAPIFAILQRMKTLLTILILAGFLGITVFGVTAMSHEEEQGHEGCLAALAGGVNCPMEASQALFLNFHLNTIKSFSLVTPYVSTTLEILLSLWTLALLFLFLGFGHKLPPPLVAVRSRRKDSRTLFLFHRNQFTRWLSLHENSPTPL